MSRRACVALCGAVVVFLLAAAPRALAGESGSPAEALTLRDCYELALKQSETIAIRREALKETEGRFLEALGAALPSASFIATEKRQDGSGGSAFTLRSVPERRFTFSQPLFSGFKEFAAMAGSRAERRQREQERVRAEQLLLVDVADAFYLLLAQREELGALETTRTALVERIDDLTERERLGRSRPSEVASAEARLRRVEADMEDVRSREQTVHHVLAFLTGRQQLDALAGEDEAPDVGDPEEIYVGRASARPDVRAAEDTWRIAKDEVIVAQAKFWPTVDVESNYYTKRAGVAQDVNWDVLFTVEVPLFQGGQNVGAVKEAASRARQAKLRYTETRRIAERDIRIAYATLEGARQRAVAFQNALASAEEAYRLQREDYQHSLVSNLEVLQALEELENARRDAIHARRDADRAYWVFRTAIGEPLERK